MEEYIEIVPADVADDDVIIGCIPEEIMEVDGLVEVSSIIDGQVLCFDMDDSECFDSEIMDDPVEFGEI